MPSPTTIFPSTLTSLRRLTRLRLPIRGSPPIATALDALITESIITLYNLHRCPSCILAQNCLCSLAILRTDLQRLNKPVGEIDDVIEAEIGAWDEAMDLDEWVPDVQGLEKLMKARRIIAAGGMGDCCRELGTCLLSPLFVELRDFS